MTIEKIFIELKQVNKEIRYKIRQGLNYDSLLSYRNDLLLIMEEM
jgi:hypothetical protein